MTIRLPLPLLAAVVLLAAGSADGAAAQGFTANVFAGAAVTTLASEAGTDFAPRATVGGGFGGGYAFSLRTSVHAELVYAIRAASADQPIEGVPARVRFQYTDIELPVYALLRLPALGAVTPTVLGGATLALNRDARLRYRALAGGPTFDVVDDAAADRVPYALAGLGADLPVGTDRLFVQARLHLGLGDIREQASSLRARTVFVVAGFAF